MLEQVQNCALTIRSLETVPLITRLCVHLRMISLINILSFHCHSLSLYMNLVALSVGGVRQERLAGVI